MAMIKGAKHHNALQVETDPKYKKNLPSPVDDQEEVSLGLGRAMKIGAAASRVYGQLG